MTLVRFFGMLSSHCLDNVETREVVGVVVVIVIAVVGVIAFFFVEGVGGGVAMLVVRDDAAAAVVLRYDDGKNVGCFVLQLRVVIVICCVRTGDDEDEGITDVVRIGLEWE
jgi:hypothetical protein